MRDQIDERRIDELTYVRWNKILVLLTAHAKSARVTLETFSGVAHAFDSFLIPLLTMIGTYATFVRLLDHY